MECCLVTGAAGFVGANLMRALLERGDDVHGITRNETDHWRWKGHPGHNRIHCADLSDAGRINGIVDYLKPTVIYHLAAHGCYPGQDNACRIMANATNTINLHRVCARHGYKLFVNAGSSSEYGRKRHAMREDDRLDPCTLYGVSKAAQTLYCQQANPPIVTLRLFGVYGPWEEPTRLIPSLLRAAMDGTPIDMSWRRIAHDFVYVGDVVRVLLGLPDGKRPYSDICNVGRGIQTTLEELLDAAQLVTGRKIDARWDKYPPRPHDSYTWVADISRLRAYGLAPETGLGAGLARTLDHMMLEGACSS